MRTTHVVFGTGAIGIALVEQLVADGHLVRAVNRSGAADVPDGVEVVSGDASDPAFAVRAAAGAGFRARVLDHLRWVCADRLDPTSPRYFDVRERRNDYWRLRAGIFTVLPALNALTIGYAFTADPAIAEVLGKEEIDRAFDLAHALRHVDAIFERALGRKS